MRPDLPPEVIEQIEAQHARDVANIRKLYNGRPPGPPREDPEGAWHDCRPGEDRGLLVIPLVISVVSAVGLLWYFFRDLVGVAPW